jgi:hypothetical protein
MTSRPWEPPPHVEFGVRGRLVACAPGHNVVCVQCMFGVGMVSMACTWPAGWQRLPTPNGAWGPEWQRRPCAPGPRRRAV